MPCSLSCRGNSSGRSGGAAYQKWEWEAVPRTSDISLSEPKRESIFSWLPTSASQLEASETNLLSSVPEEYCVERADVPVEGGFVHCVRVRRGAGGGQPLVAFHGFAGGAAMWAANIDALCADAREAYLIDCPGFGRSTRFSFDKSTPEAGEEFFLRPLEQFVREVGLESGFVLAGHSMGGYLAAKYTLRHPAQVQRLVLVDPWGVQERPDDFHAKVKDRFGSIKGPLITRVAGWGVSPLSITRGMGPWGPGLLPKYRPDLVRMWGQTYGQPEAVAHYIWHCNSQTPATGDQAFMAMQLPIAFAHLPVSRRFEEFPAELPVHFVYGDRTWMDSTAARALADSRDGTTFDFVSSSGHHPYADNPGHFNKVVRRHLTPASTSRRSSFPPVLEPPEALPALPLEAAA
eukprot:Hpha_TRINITY_DN15821_c4_g11::TRINITY_DN15821_c4_g11_i1::g.188633::m.188633/K13698/ABHD4; abhydrolase domain-containing protein 4